MKLSHYQKLSIVITFILSIVAGLNESYASTNLNEKLAAPIIVSGTVTDDFGLPLP